MTLIQKMTLFLKVIVLWTQNLLKILKFLGLFKAPSLIKMSKIQLHFKTEKNLYSSLLIFKENKILNSPITYKSLQNFYLKINKLKISNNNKIKI
jgi:hypothetical protein